MKMINLLIRLIAIIGSIIVLFTSDKNIVNLLKVLSIFLTINLPYIAESIFKIKIKQSSKFIFILFIFMSHYLGAILNFYDKYYYFDKIMHFLSGIVSSVFAYNVLIKYNSNKIYNSILTISVALAIAAIWEIYEYIASLLFKIDPQSVIETGVADTMQDIIVAILGSLIVITVYLKKRK